MVKKVHIKAGHHMFVVKLLCGRQINSKTNYVSYVPIVSEDLLCKDCLKKWKNN